MMTITSDPRPRSSSAEGLTATQLVLESRMKTASTQKTCSHCKEGKPLSEFSESKLYADGHRGQCRKCRAHLHSEYVRRVGYKYVRPADLPRKRGPWQGRTTEEKDAVRQKKYGLPPGQYDAMFAAQGGVCALCGRPEKSRPLAVDHCHTTGRIRGLLCTGCNTALGKFGDDPGRLIQAAAYLKLHEATPDHTRHAAGDLIGLSPNHTNPHPRSAGRWHPSG